MQTEGKARHFRSIKSNTGVTSVVCRELIIRKVVALIRSDLFHKLEARDDPFFFFSNYLKEIVKHILINFLCNKNKGSGYTFLLAYNDRSNS